LIAWLDSANTPVGYRTNFRWAIRRIRNKFLETDPGFDEIENYTGFGYCSDMQLKSEELP